MTNARFHALKEHLGLSIGEMADLVRTPRRTVEKYLYGPSKVPESIWWLAILRARQDLGVPVTVDWQPESERRPAA